MEVDIVSLVPEKLVIVVVCTYIIGKFLKNSIVVKDKHIPIILICFSVLFSSLIVGFSTNSILQGIICWGISIGINQMKKQIKKEE